MTKVLCIMKTGEIRPQLVIICMQLWTYRMTSQMWISYAQWGKIQSSHILQNTKTTFHVIPSSAVLHLEEQRKQTVIIPATISFLSKGYPARNEVNIETLQCRNQSSNHVCIFSIWGALYFISPLSFCTSKYIIFELHFVSGNTGTNPALKTLGNTIHSPSPTPRHFVMHPG